MANTGGRSHRRLSFPPVQEQTEDEISNCALCSDFCTSLYKPQAWRNEQAQQIAKSLCIWPDKRICRVCEDDITRPVKNPSHTPRWGKMWCEMPGCDAPSFTQSKSFLWLPAMIRFHVFSGIGKTTCLRYFYQHAEFSSNTNTIYQAH